jgi:hypothetical protein
MSTEDSIAAKDFFSCYFHEDWAHEAESASEVVGLYLANRPDANELLSVARGIDDFILRWPDETAMERALSYELGCYYLPSAGGQSVREWLEGVALTLRTKAQEKLDEKAEGDAARVK